MPPLAPPGGTTARLGAGLRRATRLTILACLLAVVPSAAGDVSGSARAGAGPQALSLYSVPGKRSFVNNIDDLARGEGHNPFGNYAGSAAPLPTSEKIFGPFAGDEANYAFSLYTSADHKTSVGSAIFVCQYNFRQDGFCDASFTLSGGSLIGKGAFNFNDKAFALAIVGGTYKYRSMKGRVKVRALGTATQAQPVVRPVPMLQAQRLSFLFQHA